LQAGLLVKIVGWSDSLTGLTPFLPFQQMEQGTWLGTEHPLFNRFTAAATHYMRVNRIPSFQAIATPSAVVHAKVGNTIGDLAPYDAQPLGGPFTVRSFDVGDIGTARRFLEVRRSALEGLGAHLLQRMPNRKPTQSPLIKNADRHYKETQNNKHQKKEK
jgi:hypothetical protein